jgi:hypothetical protein
MLFEFFAPKGLECMAASIQCFESGGIRPFTAQITPLYLFVFHPGVLFHVILSDFIFYRTGLTGFTGYFLAFRMKAKNFNRLRRIKSGCH